MINGSGGSVSQRYAILRATRRMQQGSACPGHDFSDVPVDAAKRLRAHELQCVRCHLIVPVLAAWLYEMGRRHGLAEAQSSGATHRPRPSGT